MSTEGNILQKPVVAGVLAAFCCLLWGSAFPSIKVGYRLFGIGSGQIGSQMLFAGTRFTLGGIMAILFGSLMSKQLLIPRKSSAKLILMLSLTQTAMQYFFFYIGLAHTTGMKSSIINGTNTFMAILIAALVLKREKLTPIKVIGCIIGFGGIIAININSAGLEGGVTFLGEGFMILAALSGAISTNMIKEYSQRENPVVLNGYQFVLGGVILAACGLAMGGELNPSGTGAYVLLGYMGFISAAAYSIWSILLKYNPVGQITVYGLSNPLFGAALSALILHEGSDMPIWQPILALVLVCTGIYLVNRESVKG